MDYPLLEAGEGFSIYMLGRSCEHSKHGDWGAITLMKVYDDGHKEYKILRTENSWGQIGELK